MTAPSSPNADVGPSQSTGSSDSKRLSKGGPHVDDDPLSNEDPSRFSAEVGTETIHEPEPDIPSGEVISFPSPLESPNTPQLSIHAFAQRGDTQSLIALLQSNPTLDLSARDSQDVTPLHWAAINAHMATCRFLLDNGADVDALGGDLKATPLQWAARNGHLYLVHLLLSRGADPSIRDAQGFNTLQLITHSSAVMPLLYMVSGILHDKLRSSSFNSGKSRSWWFVQLHQPVAIDEKDTDGHTALMWAAYQGTLSSSSYRSGPTDDQQATPSRWTCYSDTAHQSKQPTTQG
jgi:ankyrin repeat protein